MTESGPSPPRKWAEEDTSPTSERELRGWYSYSIAAEVYAVVGVGSFLPVTLEQLARENGVLFSDRSTSCVAPAGSSSPTRRQLFSRSDGSPSSRDPDQCIIRLFGSDITTASFAMYTFSAAVLVQALVLISFSSFADHGNNRKRLLLTFAFMGALSSMSFILIIPTVYLLAPFLVVIGVTCLGSSFVLLNSYLPLLASNHPKVSRFNTTKYDDSDKLASSDEVSELQMSDKISARGVGLGYAAAVFVQVLSILLLFTVNKLSGPDGSKTLPLRLVLFLSGIWWMSFSTLSRVWLRERPGPPLLTGVHRQESPSAIKWYTDYIVVAWTSLWRTVKVAAQLHQTSVFLLAWFLLSDAIASVSGTAILFARTELKMGTVAIALLSITAMTSGIAGAVLWPIVSRRYGWRTNRTIVACVLLMEAIPVYGLIGYIPYVQRLGVGGLQKSWEIYPLGVVHGLVMGGLSSYCRSFYGLLIPPGSEAAFFALFAVTDKGSSAIGPAVVGRIVDITGHIRPAFWFLAVLLLLPIPLVWYVDAEKGQDDARRMASILAGRDTTAYEFELRENDEAEGEGLMAGVEEDDRR